MRTLAIISFKPTHFRRAYQWAVPVLFGIFSFLNPEPAISSTEHLASFSIFTCPFLSFLDLECPGCGMTRSLIAFFSGDLSLSLYFNPFGLFIGLFIVALWVVSFIISWEQLEKSLFQATRRCSGAALVVLVVWGFLRNYLDL